MNVITLTGDSCQLHPHLTRLTPSPLLRSHRTTKKPIPHPVRPSYTGVSMRLPSPCSTSPLPSERPASKLRCRTFIGPRTGVRLSVSLQRLNHQRKERIETLLRNHKDNSGGGKTDSQRTEAIFRLKITSSIKLRAFEEAERESTGALLLRKTERQSAISSRQTCNENRTVVTRFLV